MTAAGETGETKMVRLEPQHPPVPQVGGLLHEMRPKVRYNVPMAACNLITETALRKIVLEILNATRPRGEKRPADFGHRAHRLFRIALGEEEDKIPSGLRLSGAAGAKAYAESLT